MSQRSLTNNIYYFLWWFWKAVFVSGVERWRSCSLVAIWHHSFQKEVRSCCVGAGAAVYYEILSLCTQDFSTRKQPCKWEMTISVNGGEIGNEGEGKKKATRPGVQLMTGHKSKMAWKHGTFRLWFAFLLRGQISPWLSAATSEASCANGIDLLFLLHCSKDPNQSGCKRLTSVQGAGGRETLPLKGTLQPHMWRDTQANPFILIPSNCKELSVKDSFLTIGFVIQWLWVWNRERFKCVGMISTSIYSV